MGLRRRYVFVLGAATAALMTAVGLGGAAVTGQAAITQQVTASIVCEPTTAPHGSSTGCLLTVTNNGSNTVTALTVTDTVSVGAAFLNTSDSRCVISDAAISDDDRVLTCTVAKLAGMASFSETHELQLPSSGASVVQTITGRYSPKPNSRGNDDIPPLSTSTILDTNDDFDARWANANAESVHTVSPAALDNPYSTLARVFGDGTTPFATGLSVRDDVGENVGGPSPCPTGCLGGSKIEFHISPPSGLYPASYEFEGSIDGDGADVAPGTKAEDLTIFHVTPQGTFVTQQCGDPATDPTGACFTALTVTNGTWDVFFRVVGPGTANGPWGVG
jgi:hypothetical protein